MWLISVIVRIAGWIFVLLGVVLWLSGDHGVMTIAGTLVGVAGVAGGRAMRDQRVADKIDNIGRRRSR